MGVAHTQKKCCIESTYRCSFLSVSSVVVVNKNQLQNPPREAQENPVLVLLTARSRSSYRNKNLKAVMGKPSIYYPITESMKALVSNADFFCTSDDDAILAYAHSFGFKAIKRPRLLAQDTTNHLEVLEHALGVTDSRQYSFLLVLLGNAPVITSTWILEASHKLLNNPTITSVIPYVVDQDRHPYRSKTVDHQGMLRTLFPEKTVLPGDRQSLPKAAFPAHNFWMLRLCSGKLIKDGEAPWPFFGQSSLGMELPVSICDIHNEVDVKRIEMEWNKWNQSTSYKPES